MNFKNTEHNYGIIAKHLHWITAFFFLGAYISVYFGQWFTDPKTSENWAALQLHLSFGISIGVLVVLRIIWRITNITPKEEPGTNLEHKIAKFGHLSLYTIMLILPITGYIGTGVATEFYFLFDIPKFQDTIMFKELIENTLDLTFKEFEKPIDFIHKNILGAWLAWILISGHIGAALYHHFIRKDRTLYKMTNNNNS